MNGKKKKTRRVLSILAVTLFSFILIGCIPIPVTIKDGGTVEYNAILYTYKHWHMMDGEQFDKYRDDERYKEYYHPAQTYINEKGHLVEEFAYWEKKELYLLPFIFGKGWMFD
ncbi:MAG: hypothetical protein IKN24_00255 [Lachnospiraceae bacterium]|nr:hypothetical protein [Lachnospiraceae bacterium]